MRYSEEEWPSETLAIACHHLWGRSAHTAPATRRRSTSPKCYQTSHDSRPGRDCASHSPSSAICGSMQSGIWPYRRDVCDITQKNMENGQK
ncbi:hypothetical protein EVAR_53717_1 [Eumeta japonica]|uniref:Uncharacterized protein n=1 Tax=Eumeta variegata TaxID=151549 RepID=A0A4C1Z2B0_EUMVA|nr:hypothetical protein EVAR_53717_1 [Eumeta japonica]